MNFDTLNNKNRKVMIGFGLFIVVILTIILTTSLAKYKVTERINIASGTINYSPSDFNLMGIYIESDNGYTQSDTIPESGYTLNQEESYCKVGDTEQDVTINYDFENQALSITPMTSKGLKCYLYFDLQALAKDIILATKTMSERTDFSTIMTGDTTGTVYSAEDNDGTSYYYAGAPTDNWVKFAEYYWRIIRINGDGTIRLLYVGTSTAENGFISSNSFNTSYDNNMYVGYMYTSDSVHGLGTNSIVKGALDDWYTNLNNYTNYIDDNAGFCGDRQPMNSDGSLDNYGGTGTTSTYYAAYVRLEINKSPSLKCNNSNDLYTVSNSNKGNKALTYPIGLITADEIAFAGGVQGVTNQSYYLYTGTGNYFWTMTPSRYLDGYADMFYLGWTGDMNISNVGAPKGIRPVINLRADVTLTGSGTSTDPYIVS